ncbi:hypothetical protein [Glaciecola petra]|uniref:Major tail protein n=1 Tax=Glaciecola petra TaxID=3075602 RepID=A0ABU2ZY18_9ALTE|nr:hypothetical protein [Aestuariibacter sp. P117]MDT0596479.1 hypothetical protein [Aestuariibacter sp. P117]
MNKTLEALNELSLGNACTIDADRDAKLMECIDFESRGIWMATTPVSKGDFKKITDMPTGFVLTGLATPSYDYCLFRRSTLDKTTVTLKSFAGYDWVQNAYVEDMEDAEKDGLPKKGLIDKDHVLAFDAGRTLKVMTIGTNDYVEVVGSGRNDDQLEFPEGATLREIKLKTPLILELPQPTTVYFWFPAKGQETRSFQGPVALPNEYKN